VTANSLEEQLPQLIPLAVDWANHEARRAYAAGTPLPWQLLSVAREVGVSEPGWVRLLSVDAIPLPADPLLRAAAAQVGFVEGAMSGLTLGYAIFVRQGEEENLRLLRHELRHVAQYESCGGIAEFLNVHLRHLARFGYEDSPFEVDARQHES
jgi:hypothetical protein